LTTGCETVGDQGNTRWEGGLKGVFDVKSGSGYDDDITRCYHFPGKRDYLDAARACIGDWVVYREPQRNNGRKAYIATARVARIEPDLQLAGHYYAYVTDYLAFPDPVPFVVEGRYAEAPLRAIQEPSRVGQALQGKSIRPLAQEDFVTIVLAGLKETLAPENAVRLGLDYSSADLAPPFQYGFAEDAPRRVEQMLMNRIIRDANFRLEICNAYKNTCAVTGLRIINGGGRAEVQAAHIKPVAAGGPDVVQNGIALSATVHWLFDRHLISIDEDFRLLVAHNRVPRELVNFLRPQQERLLLPDDRRLWPHPAFVAHHREAYAGAVHRSQAGGVELHVRLRPSRQN
jgi:putative restriction endonuclease